MAQAERLREGCDISVFGAVGDGYRYSFILSSAPIHFVVIEVRNVFEIIAFATTYRCFTFLHREQNPPTRVRCLTWEGGNQHSCCDRERSTHPELQEMGFGPGRGSA